MNAEMIDADLRAAIRECEDAAIRVQLRRAAAARAVVRLDTAVRAHVQAEINKQRLQRERDALRRPDAVA